MTADKRAKGAKLTSSVAAQSQESSGQTYVTLRSNRDTEHLSHPLCPKTRLGGNASAEGHVCSTPLCYDVYYYLSEHERSEH